MAVENKENTVICIVFGRPGAGKTTISTKAIELCSSNNTSNNNVSLIKALDLDICVPQWMRDNFAKGIYPTLEERRVFAYNACDYLDKEISELSFVAENKVAVIVSFSFVNKDLRDIFRDRFAEARWVLIDTNDKVARDRIDQREGHFFKNKSISRSAHHDEGKGYDDSEWKFSPVDFDHTCLNGLNPIEENANNLLRILLG